MYERVEENIVTISKNRRIDGLLKNAVSEMKFNEKSKAQYIISVGIALPLSYVIAFTGETVPLMSKSIEIINGAALAIIAVIFGTYSIFQALMTDSVMWALLKSENNLLNISNKSFLNLVMLYWTEITFNIVMLISLNVIPNDFCLLESLVVTNFLAFIFIAIYFVYCFLLFYEVRNFAVNLYQMFNVYNVYRGLELLEKKNEENVEE